MNKVWSFVGCLLFFCCLSWTASPVKAATFTMQTGLYSGTGLDNHDIAGLGFSPDLVLLKDTTNNGTAGVIFKTSNMPGELSLVLSENDANLTTNHIQSLNADGFTVGNATDANAENIMYYYTAFGGSDCSATGTFCVGSYTGNGTSQSIATVGFTPDVVIVKRAGTTAGIWKSTSMTGAVSNYFGGTAELATQGITSLDTAGFTIGSNIAVNTNLDTYYYIAFSEVPAAMDVGTYAGDGIDARTITSADDAGLTFKPSFVFTKNTTNRFGVGSIREHYGDRSFTFTDGNSNRNYIQDLLDSGGFEVGTNRSVNRAGDTYHYLAFGGAPAHSAGLGTYTMSQGSYTGTGAGFALTGVGFEPDLVLINGENAQYQTFRTSLMHGDRSAIFAGAENVYTGGILSLDSDGFSVGTSDRVNTAGVTYYWTAFGNASQMNQAGGASDFWVGQYIGSGDDDTDVYGLPLQPELIAVKRAGTTFGTWRTSQEAGDASNFFSNTNQNTNRIQALNTDGFQKGTNGGVNGRGSIYDYFIFATNDRLITDTYTGNGVSTDLTTAGFQPDLLWVKKTGGGGGTSPAILRSSEQLGDGALPFTNVALVTNAITNLILNGFTINTDNTANQNTRNYQYAAWNNKNYTQQSYRFFANDDSTDVGTALESTDTAATLTDTGDEFRLRTLVRIDGGNLFTTAEEFKLQYAERVGTCDTAFVGEVYVDVTAISPIAFFDNTTPANNDPLTTNANDPLDGARTVVNQNYQEANPFTNSAGAITQNQTGKWDFSLIDNGAPAATTYCFRVVFADTGGAIDTYAVMPTITTAGPELLFSISDTIIGFDELSPTATRFATGDTLGDAIEVVAHQLSAATNAPNGYTISVQGSTLTNSNNNTIDAIGSTAIASTTETEQFGMRAEVASGTATVTAPFNTALWAYDDASSQILANGTSDNIISVIDLYYLANISRITPAGAYQAHINFLVTAGF